MIFMQESRTMVRTIEKEFVRDLFPLSRAVVVKGNVHAKRNQQLNSYSSSHIRRRRRVSLRHDITNVVNDFFYDRDGSESHLRLVLKF